MVVEIQVQNLQDRLASRRLREELQIKSQGNGDRISFLILKLYVELGFGLVK